MTDQEIFAHIDHTLLKAASSWEEVNVLCDEAVRYNTASVCIPPSYVKPVFEKFGKKPVICTVIGFPLGYNTSSVKAFETEQAITEGAAEIDMVINIGDVKNGHFDRVLKEIKLLKGICGNKILKVIVETCYLSEDEKIRLCKIVSEAGADFIKTSTGFGSAGAALDDVRLMKMHIDPGIKIKAAGGIRTREDFVAFIEAGASRIGASSAVKALAQET